MITNTRTHVCLLLSFAFRFLALGEWCLTQQTMLWPDGVSSRYHHACYNYASNNPLICTYIIVIIMGVQVRIDVHGARLIARVDEHQEEVYLKGLNHDTNYGVATNLPSVVLVGGECIYIFYISFVCSGLQLFCFSFITTVQTDGVCLYLLYSFISTTFLYYFLSFFYDDRIWLLHILHFIGHLPTPFWLTGVDWIYRIYFFHLRTYILYDFVCIILLFMILVFPPRPGLSSEEKLHGVKYIIESFVGCIRNVVLSAGKAASDLLPITPLIATKHENVKEGCFNKCHSRQNLCFDRSRCINHYYDISCDCFGTQYEGEQCDTYSEYTLLC